MRKLKRKPMLLLPLLVIALIATSVVIGYRSCSEEEPDTILADTVYHFLLDTPTVTPVKSGPYNSFVYNIPTYIVPGRLNEIFLDSNYHHVKEGEAIGIKPIDGLRGAYDTRRNIVRIFSCDDYLVDSMMTYSAPYLVPQAAVLLRDIAHEFHDTVKARGGKDYRIKVTSLMRTNQSVSRLKRFNRAATDQSSHRYGTSFDISWVKFDSRDTSHIVSLEDLKNVLAEIVYAKRQQGRCYAIFEKRQGCFHITVRQQPKQQPKPES